jgi:hypothetical protein
VRPERHRDLDPPSSGEERDLYHASPVYCLVGLLLAVYVVWMVVSLRWSVSLLLAVIVLLPVLCNLVRPVVEIDSSGLGYRSYLALWRRVRFDDIAGWLNMGRYVVIRTTGDLYLHLPTWVLPLAAHREICALLTRRVGEPNRDYGHYRSGLRLQAVVLTALFAFAVLLVGPLFR